jgi:hypothetical protein
MKRETAMRTHFKGTVDLNYRIVRVDEQVHAKLMAQKKLDGEGLNQVLRRVLKLGKQPTRPRRNSWKGDKR